MVAKEAELSTDAETLQKGFGTTGYLLVLELCRLPMEAPDPMQSLRFLRILPGFLSGQQRGMCRGAPRRRLGKQTTWDGRSPANPTLMAAFLTSKASPSIQNPDLGADIAKIRNLGFRWRLPNQC